MAEEAIKEGRKAPAFSLDDHEGKKVTLKEYSGRYLVLYFYPRDNTPGCTLEAKDFTCLEKEFDSVGVSVLGLSRDGADSHIRFRDKQELTIRLASDPEHAVMEKYGVWREKKMYGKTSMGVVRSTFLIGPDGKVLRVWDNVKTKGHAQAVLDVCKEIIS